MNDSPYKIEEIVKDPVKLSLWLDSKDERLSPSYKALLDNPDFKLDLKSIPATSKVKGRALKHLKQPEMFCGDSPSLEVHATNKGINGNWIYPNVALAIEQLNPGEKLNKADTKATLDAWGLKPKLLPGFKQTKKERVVQDPKASVNSPYLKDYPNVEEMLEILFGNSDITWGRAMECITKQDLSNGIPNYWKGVDHETYTTKLTTQPTIQETLIHPPLAKHHVTSDSKWNKYTLTREYTIVNGFLVLEPKLTKTIKEVSTTEDTYGLPNPPKYYLQLLEDAVGHVGSDKHPPVTNGLVKYLLDQSVEEIKGEGTYIRYLDKFKYGKIKFDSPEFTEAPEDVLIKIRNFLNTELSERHLIKGEICAFLAGLEVYKRFEVIYDVRRSFLGK